MCAATYESFAEALRGCRACLFRNDSLEPIVPAKTTIPTRVMFVGENPSWADVQRVPFDPATNSGKALEENYLQPLGLSRSEVWITDLLKCRYPKGIYHDKHRREPEIREAAACCAKRWLLEEIRLARPSILVTLSAAQVYHRLRRIFSLSVPADFDKAVGKAFQIELPGRPLLLFPMIHPDITRLVAQGGQYKSMSREKWAVLHREVHVPQLKLLLE